MSPAQGPPAQGTRLLDAFLSLLAGFTAQANEGEEVSPEPTNSGQQNKKDDKKNDKRESLAALFASVPIPQAGPQSPLTLAFPLATSNSGPLMDAGTPANAARSESPVSTGGPGSPAIPASFVSEQPVLSLSLPPFLSPIGANMRAPITFALRLEPAIAGTTLVAAEASAPISEANSGHAQPAHGGPLAQLVQAPSSTSAAANTPPSEQPWAQPFESLSPPSATPTATPLAAAPVPDQNAAAAVPKIMTGPNVATAPNDAHSEQAIQPATPDAVRRPAHSQASSSPDDGSTKHEQQVGIPPVPHAMMGDVRTEPALTRDATPRTLAREDTQPVATPAAEVSDTSAALRSQPIREISMRLTPAESPSVDITLVDRAGSLHVAVRTPDSELAHNLQSGLSDLVHRLERKGFEAEAWSPGDSSGSKPATSAQADGNGSASQRNGRDPRDGAQQGNGGQQNQGRNRPKWVLELEQKLATTNAK